MGLDRKGCGYHPHPARGLLSSEQAWCRRTFRRTTPTEKPADTERTLEPIEADDVPKLGSRRRGIGQRLQAALNATEPREVGARPLRPRAAPAGGPAENPAGLSKHGQAPSGPRQRQRADLVGSADGGLSSTLPSFQERGLVGSAGGAALSWW